MPGTERERSFVALKPDAVQRGLIGDIVKRFEGEVGQVRRDSYHMIPHVKANYSAFLRTI